MRGQTPWAAPPHAASHQPGHQIIPIVVEKKNKRMRAVAAFAAVGVAVGAYGVYATTLTIGGTAGTNLQAGSAAVDPDTRCDTDGMTVTENWSDSTLDGANGYTASTRQSWTISGISANCEGQSLSLAVLSAYGDGEDANRYVQVGTATADGAATNQTIDVPIDWNDERGDEGDTLGYSIRVGTV
jgi:hypothetical protein